MRSARSTKLVRQEIINSDARDLETTIRAQLLTPLVALNFGPTAPVPKFVIETPQEEPEIEEWHVTQGIVSGNEVRERLRLPMRDGLDELRQSGTGAPPVSPSSPLFSEQDDPWWDWYPQHQ